MLYDVSAPANLSNVTARPVIRAESRRMAWHRMDSDCLKPGRYYKYDMTDDEAIELGKRAIYHATHRDAYSGSINNVYIVKPTGWVKVHAGDVNEMHYKIAEEKAAIAAARAGAQATEAP